MLKSLFRALAAVTVVALVAPLVGCNGARDNALRMAETSNGKTGFKIKEYKRPTGESRKYALFIPSNYSANVQYPVIIFLHGVGEGGSDARANLRVGLAPFVADKANSFQSIVVFPQSPGGGWSASGNEAEDIIGILNEIKKQYSVDSDRVTLTGLSTGGYGTWAIGAKYVNTFAALAPMGSSSAIGDSEAKILADAKIPIRAYCNPGDMCAGFGLNDPGMVERVKKYGGNAEFEEGRGSGHNVWDPVYGDGSLFAWLSTKRLSARGVKSNTVTPAAPARSTSSVAPAKSSPSSTSAIIPATPY